MTYCKRIRLSDRYSRRRMVEAALARAWRKARLELFPLPPGASWRQAHCWPEQSDRVEKRFVSTVAR